MAPKSSTSALSGKGAATRDWNEIWASRKLADLSDIPVHNYGYCGCSICGKKKSIKGSTFVAHMIELHAPKPPAYKRARTVSKTPGPSPLPSQPSLPAFASTSQPSFPPQPLNDDDDAEYEDIGGMFASDNVGTDALSSAPAGETTGTSRLPPTQPAPLFDLPDLQEELTEEVTRRALETMSEFFNTEQEDLPSIRPFTPEPVEDLPLPSPGAFVEQPPLDNDYLHLFKGIDMPIWMTHPLSSGARPNPHQSFLPESMATPIFQRSLPLLAHALSGLYNVARRPINLVLQVANIIVRNAENRLYQRFRRWYIARHPEASPEVLDDLDSCLNPAFDVAAAPNTLETALRRIGVSSTTIVHPVCPNRECSNVFYAITTREGFGTLPRNCPACDNVLYDPKGQPKALHFARRSIKDELEVVLAVRGVEDALDRRDQRRDMRDQEDNRAGGAWGKVYRQQDDGTAWTERSNVSEALKEALQLTVNMTVDWANTSSKRSAATNSIGPIILQLADLPAQLRSSFACTMVVGITPPPKAPKSTVLYKLLLPLAMELRDAEKNGLWLQTPRHPYGRLVRVRLGLVVCDRPAGCEVTGAGPYQAHRSPCLRCHLHQSQIVDLSLLPHPLRNADEHTRGIFRQIETLPATLQAHKEAFKTEQQRLVAAGLIPRAAAYTKAMVNEAIASNNQQPGHISALMAIPGYDRFGWTIFDPMHSLLEGLVKTYFHKVLIAGQHGSTGDDQADQRGAEEERDSVDDNGVRGESAGEDSAGVDSAGDTEWGSETEATLAHSVADRVLGGFERGAVVIPTQAEIAVLRKGVKDMGKKKKKSTAKATKPRKKRLGPQGTVHLQHLIAAVNTPTLIPRLHPEFGLPSAGTPTASHWRAFAAVYAPLTIPLLFHERGRMTPTADTGNAHLTAPELRAMMLLFEVIALALRTSLSDHVLARLDTLIETFLGLAFSLHPTLSKSTNFHVITHLTTDIKRFGPATGWWTFPTERVNYVIKNVNMSGANRYQTTVVGLRAVGKAKQMISARLNALDVPETGEQEDRDLVSELEDTFEAFHQEAAADTLEQIALRFAEIDRLSLSRTNALSSRDILVDPRGNSQERTLNDATLLALQDCLRKYGQSTRSVLDIEEGDLSHPYLPSRGLFWQGVTFAGRRLDSAEWGKPLMSSLDSSAVQNLVCARNSLFESRTEEHILGGQDRRVVTAVLCAVFEHRASGEGGVELEPRLFGIIRKLKAYDGLDTYGYRQHPALNVWLWEHDSLEDPVVLWLNPKTLTSLRPLAVAALPKAPGDSSGKVWATVPVPYH